MTLNTFSKRGFAKVKIGVLSAGLAFATAMAAPASAQTVGVPTSDNPYGMPAGFTLSNPDASSQRGATAIVNGYVITATDINQRVALITNAAESAVSPEEIARLRMRVLGNLIDETLQIQAAQALEIGAEQSQIVDTYQQLAVQNFGQNPERMDEYLTSIGSSRNALYRQIEGEIAWDNLLSRNVTPFVNVSAEEVNEVLRRQEADRGTEEYRLGEIYMSATDENREAVVQNMQRIVDQLQQGGSFQAYARQFSEATTAVVGGDTGYLRLETLPREMSDVVRQMEAGQLVGPIEVPGGFTIIYLIDKRQILMADPRDTLLNLQQISLTFPEGSTEAQMNAQIERFGTFLQTLNGCADAGRATTELGATVVASSDLQLRQLPRQLQAIMMNLEIGDVTPAFGSPEEGIRVLMLCGRESPPDAGAPTFQSVMNSIRQERITKRAQKYLRDLRNDAYILYN